MKRGLLVLILALFQFVVYAQKTIKTDVLIIGNNNSAAAASLQAVKSGVKAVLLSDTPVEISMHSKVNQAGIAAAILRKSAETDDANLTRVFKVLTDSLKDLQIFENTVWEKLERSGSGWNVRIRDGRTIRAKVLVYALPNDGTTSLQLGRATAAKVFDYSTNIYKTSVGSSIVNGQLLIIPAFSLVLPNSKNLVLANAENASFNEGQAAGATAAYGSFYGVDASQVNLKAVQGELMNFKLDLLPFEDIKTTDTNWRAIQEFALSGMIKVSIKDGKAFFMPEQVIQFGEISQPLKDLYYKAQIWLDDNKNVPMNLENVISMVSYVGNKSAENTLAQIEKQWKKAYQFTSDFNLKKLLTRREFAVIVRDYLAPFNVNIDKVGRVLR